MLTLGRYKIKRKWYKRILWLKSVVGEIFHKSI